MKHLARLFVGLLLFTAFGLIVGLCIVNPIIFAVLFITAVSYCFGAVLLLELEMDGKK